MTKAPHLLEKLKTDGVTLSLTPSYNRRSDFPLLLLAYSQAPTQELRKIVKEGRKDLINWLLRHNSTARDWQLALSPCLWPCAELVEYARRGLLPCGPVRAANVDIENPSEWILKAVRRINQIMSGGKVTSKDRAKIKRALVILEAIECWAEDSMWG